MSITNRLTHSLIDELGIDPLRDDSFDAVRGVAEYSNYVVNSTDRNNLPLIAFNTYGSRNLWWAILIYNDYADPFSIQAGDKLRIPDYSLLIDALVKITNKAKVNNTVTI